MANFIESDRRRALSLLAEGETLSKVSKSIGCCEQTLRNWKKKQKQELVSPAFIPLTFSAEPANSAVEPEIEITSPNGYVIRLSAELNADHLAKIFEVIRRC